MAELLEQIRQLSVHEQLALIREITLNLESDGEVQLSPADEAELARRVAAADANPLEGDDWATVRARIEAQAGTTRAQTAEKLAA